MNQDVMPRRRRPKPKATPQAQTPDEPQQPEVPVEPDSVEPTFKPPEVVAAEDSKSAMPAAQQPTTPPSQKKRRWWPHGRRQWIIFAAVLVVLLGGGGTAWALTHQHHPEVAVKRPAVVKPTHPALIYSDLSGLPITDASLNKKPVTAVMIENSLDARPQSGLSQAGVVFEAQAEGGVTRFMALYQDTAPSNVGPIRSARPYYVQWALGFDAAYAHVGGSTDALSDITQWGVQDMNQFYNGDYYHRVSTRAAPHNVYTSISTLNQLEAKKHYSSKFSGYPRTTTATPLAQPTAKSITLGVSGPLYNPQYTYSTTTNSYNRSTDGTPDTDANTGKQLSPSVVIAMVVPLSRGALDSSGAYYSDYNVIGSGTVYIFQDGGVTIGQWHKTSNSAQLTFTTSSGAPIPLNRGQTWITAVSATNQVSYM